MTKTVHAPRTGATAVLALLLAGSLPWLAGCPGSCEDLQEVCDACLDPNQKASCERLVDADDQDQCAVDIDNFEDICDVRR